MNLVRWDPFQTMTFCDWPFGQPSDSGTCTPIWRPSVDIEETETALKLHAELPGVKPEEITVELDGDTLIIRGERTTAHEAKEKQFVRVERAYGRFQRSFLLQTPVKTGEITASYHDGMLDIVLPKAEAPQPRQIEVKAEEPHAA